MIRQIALGVVIAFVSLQMVQADDAEPAFNPRSFVFDHDEAALLAHAPAARAEDVASPEAITKALHEAVSGPKGVWDDKRLRSLFVPEPSLEYTDEDASGTPRFRAVTLDELVHIISGIHKQQSWYERAGALKVVQLSEEGAKEKMAVVSHALNYGVNPVAEPSASEPSSSTTEVVRLQGRWWIASLIW